MATKRMFDKAIIDTDRFMDLPVSAKAFYFLLGMEADDEGFVSYKKVQRIHGGTDDDIRILTAKGFTILFPSGVVVITHWNKNNYLDKNRIKETEYQEEKKQLLLTSLNKYELNNRSTSIEESSIEENKSETKVSQSEEVKTKPPSWEEFLEEKGFKQDSVVDDDKVSVFLVDLETGRMQSPSKEKELRKVYSSLQNRFIGTQKAKATIEAKKKEEASSSFVLAQKIESEYIRIMKKWHDKDIEFEQKDILKIKSLLVSKYSEKFILSYIDWFIKNEDIGIDFKYGTAFTSNHFIQRFKGETGTKND